MIKHLLAFGLGLAVCATTGVTSAQPPTLTHAAPSAVAPGQTVDVTLHGGTLAGASKFWTNLGITSELAPGITDNGTNPAQVVYRLTVPADHPVGIGGIRVATPQGISNLRLLMVDDLATVMDSGANKTRETAQPLTLPVAVDGACEAESYDFYTFQAAAGQRLSVEVVAQRLGSLLDPAIRLMDASGRELIYSDDEGGIGLDCRFSHTIAVAGQYTIEVRDIRYQGGATHRYRLRVGDFPLVTVPYPLGAQKGSSAKISVAGPAVETVLPIDMTMPPDLAGGQVSISARYPNGQGSGFASLVASSLPETVEVEANNLPEQSSAIITPCAINGRFEAPRDRDFYQFEAKATQRLVFRGKTRSLGSPSDLFMRLLNADGAVLAEAEDSGADEGLINFTFPADGIYRLTVEDLLHRGGPAHAYRVEVEPYQPGFTLALDAEKFDAPKGGVFVAKVVSVRQDYNGPITLELAGAPEGFVLANNVIAEGANETLLNVTAPPQLDSASLAVFRIVGRAKIGEVDFVAKASSLTPLRAQLAGLPYPPADLDGAVGLGVGPVFPDFFQLSVAPPEILFPQLIGSGSFNVVAQKLNGFNDPIALSVEGLPAGVTAEVKPIEKDQPQATIVLKGPETLPEGEHKVRIVGSATFQNQPKSIPLADVVLRVIKPLGVAVAPAGPIAVNGKQKVKVTVTRYGEDKAAVALTFKNLPAGITVPDGSAVPEGLNEVEIELTAAADAAPGKVENLAVVAATKVKGADITVESPPAALEVVAAQ